MTKYLRFIVIAPIALLAMFCVAANSAPPTGNASDDAVEQRLSDIETGKGKRRKAALRELEDELGSNLRNRQARVSLSHAKRAKLIRSLIKAYREESGADKDSQEIRAQIAETITSHGDSPEAKQYVDEMMASGDEHVRQRIMVSLGHVDGISGDDLMAKISEWTDKGYIPKKARHSLLVKVGREKAIPEILKTVDSTKDREDLFYAGWALQDVGSRKDMARMFRRAKELGLDKKYKDAPDGLYWVDRKKLVDYVRQSDGDDLKTILDLMAASPTMKPAEMVPVLQSKLGDPSADNRVLAAKRLAEASENPRMDYDSAIQAVEQRLASESDVGVKAEMTKSLRSLKRRQVWSKSFLKREQDWIKKNKK